MHPLEYGAQGDADTGTDASRAVEPVAMLARLVQASAAESNPARVVDRLLHALQAAVGAASVQWVPPAEQEPGLLSEIEQRALQSGRPAFDSDLARRAVCLPVPLAGSAVGLLTLETDPGDAPMPPSMQAALHVAGRLVGDAYLIEELRASAIRHAQSGWNTRSYFDVRLREQMSLAQRYSRTLSLVLLKVAVLSPPTGEPIRDHYLHRIARHAELQRRACDLCALYADDTLAYLLPETSASEALAFANLLVAVLQDAPFQGVLRPNVHVRAFFAVCEYEDRFTTAEDILAAAEAELANASQDRPFR